MTIYRLFFRLVLARIDPERAHDLAIETVRLVSRFPGARKVAQRRLAAADPALRVRAWGMEFAGPLGVAAGMDKNVRWFEELGALGFGSVEVGTITASPQPGRPKPRVFRLTKDRALLNGMGFPNCGAEVAAERLRGRRAGTIVGVNVGKSADAALESADEDYRETVRRVAAQCDFLVLNVSSPNTAGLRSLQDANRLDALVEAVRLEADREKPGLPLLIKIAPDLHADEIDAIADLAVRQRLAGVVAVNTTVSRENLTEPIPEHEGGISGAPLKRRAVEVLERLRARAGDDLVLVSVGGVETADDVWERMAAGATLVQSHTGFVYGGPLWPRSINKALAARVRASGMSSIQELIGSGRQTSRAAAQSDGDRDTLREATVVRR